VVPVVVISLARSADRRTAVRRNLDSLGIAHTFFDAVDGRAMSADAIAAIAPRPYVGQSSRPLSAGRRHAGCARSHSQSEGDGQGARRLPAAPQSQAARQRPGFQGQ